MAGTIEQDFQALERSLTLLRVDYERFFSGDLRQPPVRVRKAIEEILKRVGSSKLDKAADRFRLQSMQSRFTALTELWEKRLLAREEGRGQPLRSLPPPIADPPATGGDSPRLAVGSSAAAARPSGDGSAAASVQSRQAGLAPLFDRYCEARRALGEDVSGLRFERFEELVRKQAAEIRRATGATKLVFEVQTANGKVRLLGRPILAVTKGNE